MRSRSDSERGRALWHQQNACLRESLLSPLSPLHKNYYQDKIYEPDSQCELSDNVFGGPFLQKQQKGAGYEGNVEPDVKCRSTKKGIHFLIGVFPVSSVQPAGRRSTHSDYLSWLRHTYWAGYSTAFSDLLQWWNGSVAFALHNVWTARVKCTA